MVRCSFFRSLIRVSAHPFVCLFVYRNFIAKLHTKTLRFVQRRHAYHREGDMDCHCRSRSTDHSTARWRFAAEISRASQPWCNSGPASQTLAQLYQSWQSVAIRITSCCRTPVIPGTSITGWQTIPPQSLAASRQPYSLALTLSRQIFHNALRGAIYHQKDTQDLIRMSRIVRVYLYPL